MDVDTVATMPDSRGLASQYGPEAALLAVAAVALRSTWARTWLTSGAAVLTYVLIAGGVRKRRILPWAPLWLLVVLINLGEAAAATSWLFYWLFVALCWPVIGIASLFAFDAVADTTRRALRNILRAVHFTADSVAFFDLPALLIDQDVDGLMAIRGVTFSFSSLTLVAHGIEVGIKVSDDIEVALQADKVTVALFRRISIDNVFANIKGGSFEQAFGTILNETPGSDEGASRSPTLMLDDSEVGEKAKEMAGDSDAVAERLDEEPATSDHSREASSASLKRPVPPAPDNNESPRRSPETFASEPTPIDMSQRMTNGSAPQVTDAETGLEHADGYAIDDGAARERYLRSMKHLEATSGITQARREVEERAQTLRDGSNDKAEVSLDSEEEMRAAICSRLHGEPSVQHPPKRSVRVTTLQNALPPRVRKMLHRMPMLLRGLLCPLAYFHPVRINSVTAGAPGRWLKLMLDSELFRSYAESSADIRKLRERVFEWLSDANFIISLKDVGGLAQVPFIPDNDIDCRLLFDEINVFRALPNVMQLIKVLQLGGADASFLVPSFLLPHHEHLLPTLEERERNSEALRGTLKRGLSQPKVVQTEQRLKSNDQDETQVKMSTHLHLPACCDQELLNFVSTLVKASKIIEFEKSMGEAMTGEVRSLQDFKTLVKAGMREGVKRTAVNAAANDRWIAKMVGKATARLETLQGDVGYSGDIRVPLKPYRERAEPETKILP